MSIFQRLFGSSTPANPPDEQLEAQKKQLELVEVSPRHHQPNEFQHRQLQISYPIPCTTLISYPMHVQIARSSRST
jgi:hypothetical protein